MDKFYISSDMFDKVMFHHNFTYSNIEEETNKDKKENEQEINLTYKEVINSETVKGRSEQNRQSNNPLRARLAQSYNNSEYIKNLVKQSTNLSSEHDM